MILCCFFFECSTAFLHIRKLDVSFKVHLHSYLLDKTSFTIWAWRCTSLIPALKRQRQASLCEFEASVVYTSKFHVIQGCVVRLCQFFSYHRIHSHWFSLSPFYTFLLRISSQALLVLVYFSVSCISWNFLRESLMPSHLCIPSR